jgi:uncharacterized protein (TIGR03437 family)
VVIGKLSASYFFRSRAAATLFIFTCSIAPLLGTDVQPAFGCAGRAIVGSFDLSTGDNGPAVQAELFVVSAMARDGAGNVYIADSSNENVRKVNTAGIITTIAGNGIPASTGDGGPAIQASLNNPQGIAVDAAGNVYISEMSGNRIRRVSTDGTITTIAGNGRAGFSGDGSAAVNAMLWKPAGLAVDSMGNLLVSDTGNFRLRRIAADGTITTIAGSGSNATPADPDGLPATSIIYTGNAIALTANGDIVVELLNSMLVAYIDLNGIVHDITAVGGAATPVEGAAARQATFNVGGIGATSDGNIFIESLPDVWQILPSGLLHHWASGVDASTILAELGGPVLAGVGQVVFSLPKSGAQTVFAGISTFGNSGNGGPAAAALFDTIGGLAADKAGNVYISDWFQNVIRRVTPDGTINAFAGTGGGSYTGDGGPATQAQIGSPRALAVDPFGNVYVAQNFAGTFVRKIAPDGTITHFAGTGRLPEFCEPFGCGGGGEATNASVSVTAIASDSKGQIFLLDQYSAVIWKIDLQGNLSQFFSLGTYAPGGSAGSLPAEMQIDSAGNIYVSGLIIAPTGKFISGSYFLSPAFAIDAQGNVDVATGAGKLLKLSPAGVWSTLWDTILSPNTNDAMFPLTMDPAGNLYFADQIRNRVFEIPNAVSCTGPQRPLIPFSSVYNAASYASSSVAPGELVSFFGNYVGPAQAAGPSVIDGNRFDTQAGGARVLFDGVPAPMLYASAGQVSAVVPYGIAGQTATQVSVEFNGTLSDALTVPVVDAFPGIFTADSSGQGQTAATNSDGLPNSPSHPAAIGSTITFFITGAGVMTPAAVDGVIAGATPPTPMLPVVVTMGGEPATVTYAGGAPFEINGVLQVNVVIPALAPNGSNISLGIQIGKAQSQGAATVAIQ